MVDRSQPARAAHAQPSRLEVLRHRYEWLDRLLRAASRYQSQYGDYHAAAITYFSVLALVPLLMIAFSIAGFVLAGNPALLGHLKTSIANAVPNASLSQLLGTVIDQAIGQAGTVGIIGLLAALYSGLSWMTNLREALTAQWSQEPTTLPFLKRTVSDLFALIGLGLAMAVSFGISTVGSRLGWTVFALIGVQTTPAAGFVLFLLTLALSLLANWLVFLWVLARLPRKPVTWRSARWGALFAAVGLEVLKQVGVIYLNTVTGSPAGAAFGPILGLLVFVYLTSRFILFVTAWTASAKENLELISPQPPGPAVIRPMVLTRRTGAGTAAGLLGLGAVAGWLWRRR